MIRLAISCDVCGEEKRQTNHWFVAYEQGGELRVGGWQSRYRNKAGARHLCGQTCLHKLVDEFMAQTIAGDRVSALAEQSAEQSAEPPSLESASVELRVPAAPPISTPAPTTPNISVSSTAAYTYEDEFGSSARLIPTPAHAAQRPLRVVATPVRTEPPVEEESPRYLSHQWRAAAWERERARGMHSSDRHSENSSRRKGA